jgi:hypothetical protein
MNDSISISSIANADLVDVSGARAASRSGDYPGFQNCGPMLFSKGCVDGGMSLDEWSAISSGGKMVNGGGTATFDKWARWMRQKGYPSAALDRAGR